MYYIQTCLQVLHSALSNINKETKNIIVYYTLCTVYNMYEYVY